MPGYSGTPLPQKLGLKPKQRVGFFNLPAEVRSELKTSLAECEIVTSGALDYAQLFTSSLAQLEKEFPRYTGRLRPDGLLWASWPKKSSGVATDVTEADVRRVGLACGLVDVKVCAVSDIWSGLKFVYRVKDRKKKSS